MARIGRIQTALPPHRHTQEELRAVAERIFGPTRFLSIFENAGVQTRYLARPAASYIEESGFGARNRAAVEASLALAQQACRGLTDGIATLVYVTTTAVATPSIDARLGLDPGVRRVPIFGVGCSGGAAALARAAELPGPALVISSEVCSLTFLPNDRSPTNVVAAALFGDGAAAVRVGERETGPRIVKTATRLFPNSLDVMGWDVTDAGLKLVLSQEVPRMVREHLAPMVRAFVEDAPIRHWILHPGGPRVLEAYAESLGLSDEQLEPSRSFLARHGNLSSASVLFILSEVKAQPGDFGLVASVGPGFAGDLVLLQW